MANVKFSDFAVRTTLPTVDYIVGYQGADNVQIAPTDLLGAYLPLAGGVMTGTLNFGDNVKAIWGNGSDLQIYHDTLNSYISDQGTGRLILKTNYLEVQNAAGTEAIIEGIEDGAVKLYYDGVKKFETEASGVLITSGLHVDSLSGYPTLTLARSTTHPGLSFTAGLTNFTGTGTDLVVEGVGNDTGFGFRTVNSGGTLLNTLILLPSGDVGIGTATPGYNLEVDGTATVATAPSYIVANESSGTFKMAIGVQNSPGVAQEAFVGTLGNTDFKLRTNSVDIGRFTTSKKFMIGSSGVPDSTVHAFTGGNTVDAALLLQHDSFAAGRLCGMGFELGSTQVKAAIAVKADLVSIGTHGRSNIIFCVDSVDDANPVTHNDEKMRITHAGDVGIGLTTLYNKLGVAGNINIQGGDGGFLTFNNGDANITIHTNGSGRDLSFKTYDGTSNAERMRITKDGDVGIGTATPQTNAGYSKVLQIHGTLGTVLKLTDDTSGSGVSDGFEMLQYGDASYLINRENGIMAFSTNNVERMRITNTGLTKINSSTSGNHEAYQKTGTYTKTSTGSTTAMTIVKVGHSHAVNYTVTAKIDTSNVGVLVGNTATAYGSNGGIIVDSEAYSGVISDIAVTYDNSYYGLNVAVTYTGVTHPIIYMAVTGQSSEDFVQQ